MLLVVISGLVRRANACLIIFNLCDLDPFSPSLMFSPLHQTRIYGDDNIGRYLCRVLHPDFYNDNDTVTALLIDRWLENSRQVRMFKG